MVQRPLGAREASLGSGVSVGGARVECGDVDGRFDSCPGPFVGL